MKLRTLIKTAVSSSIVLLCTGFVMYSFFKMTATERYKDFDLYALVPPTASAVFETGDLAGFIREVNDLECSRHDHFLVVSKLFSFLKSTLHTVLEDTPHGLSHQMNKVLFSFHEPDNDRNQVLYCSLGEGDHERIESLIGKYTSPSYPYKTFDYKDASIRVYPMEDGGFIACYLTSHFMALSFQVKLIEQVIDSWQSGVSLGSDSTFSKVYTPARGDASATVYVRMQSIAMGRIRESVSSHLELADWSAFDVKLKSSVIYFSGISHAADTSLSLASVLSRQRAVKGFPGESLPASTFFLTKRSVSDWTSTLGFDVAPSFVSSNHPDDVRQRDQELGRYLVENGTEALTTCFFMREDTLPDPVSLLILPVTHVPEAERLLFNLLRAVPKEGDSPSMPRVSFCYTPSKAYALYPLPLNTLLARLTGMPGLQSHAYAAFYEGCLLVASDVVGLSQYIRQLDRGEVLAGSPIYTTGINGLSDTYQLLLMADMADLLRQPDDYVRLIPNFFFRNADFFRHFLLSVQLTYLDGVLYPNVILSYKGV